MAYGMDDFDWKPSAEAGGFCIFSDNKINKYEFFERKGWKKMKKWSKIKIVATFVVLIAAMIYPSSRLYAMRGWHDFRTPVLL